MMSYSASIFYTFLMVLISMAYFTLLERKILAAIQMRKGPNKVGPEGLLQPLSDAVKLFSKLNNLPSNANKLMFYMCPHVKLILSLIMWIIIPNPELKVSFQCSLIFFLCVSSMMVYMIIGMGWASNSKYALLGSVRAFAQMISYEVTMGLLIIAALVMITNMDTNWIFKNNTFTVSLFSVPLVYIWFTVMLAETNRAPFDFPEAESELVSGFNIEYGGLQFAFIFMAEYVSIMSISFMTSTIILQKMSNNSVSFILMVVQSIIMMVMFIVIRGTMPRMRYDKLMELTWKYFLSITLMYISFNMLILNMFLLFT